jgi:N-acetylglutamate synthase
MPPSFVTSWPTIQADPGLVCRLEGHAIDAWPATETERVEGGWLLRATPGLDRGRSNHALTPCREVAASEIPQAIAGVEAFARRHGITPGIQVSPLSLHATLMAELDRRGWGTRWPMLVLAAPIGTGGGAAGALEADGLVGLFCLAVDPARRRAGLGSALMRALLAQSRADVAYLQVEERNAPAVALYRRLGFGEAYRYCHRVGPA